MNLRMRFVLIPFLLAPPGCAGDRPLPVRIGSQDSVERSTQFPSLPDSLALTAAGGTEVWFSGARLAADSMGGGTCIERGLLIAHGATRTLVPLLMTRSTPVLVNDTIIRALLSSNCQPGDAYEVNLRTSRPTRIR